MTYAPATKRPVVRVALPTNSDYWVEHYKDMNWAERKELRGAALQVSKPDVDVISLGSDKALIILMAVWNITGEDGEILPITPENLDVLDARDVDAILVSMGPVISPEDEPEDQAKKKASGAKPTKPSAAPEKALPTT